MKTVDMRWACAVTCVPARCDDLLPRTLASIKAAGFPDPRLFVDSPTRTSQTEWEDRFGLPCTVRAPAVRTYGSWLLAAAEMLMRRPLAERWIFFQDDVVLCRGVREYLDRTWPPQPCYLNLYSQADNEGLVEARLRERGPGWIESLRDGRGTLLLDGRHAQVGRGALALAFDRPGLTAFLQHRIAWERPLDAMRGWRNLDGGIVEAMNQSGFVEMIHAPSLAQHTGEAESTCNPRGRRWPPARSFPGESHDALAFLPGTPPEPEKVG